MSRYHMSLSATAYENNSKLIPQDVLASLCGDPDGCEVRLGMTRSDSDLFTAADTDSPSSLFYYNAADGRYDSSPAARATDGDYTKSTIIEKFGTCYLQDFKTVNGVEEADADLSIYLRVQWNPNWFHNPNRTCELTLID
jgi:hypothetical protein